MEIVESLQRGDSAALDAALNGVHWGAGDEVRRRQPQCHTLGGAVSALASRIHTASANSPTPIRSLPIFLSSIVITDSGGAGAATATLTITMPSGLQRSATIGLSYENRPEARWGRVTGLLAAVCDASTGAVR